MDLGLVSVLTAVTKSCYLKEERVTLFQDLKAQPDMVVRSGAGAACSHLPESGHREGTGNMPINLKGPPSDTFFLQLGLPTATPKTSTCG